MSRYFTILCEDLQSFVFIRRALLEAGVSGRDIFKHPFPDSRFHAAGGQSPREVDGYIVYACGYQHVLMNYPAVLEQVRKQHAKRDAALVVHIDVDSTPTNPKTVKDREAELHASCTTSKVARRTDDDPVAFLIARRTTETWIAFYLDGAPVDEDREYPKLTGCEADCHPAAVAFARDAKAMRSPPHAPSSLSVGLAELAGVL